jgi:nicotinamidase-related amidase
LGSFRYGPLPPDAVHLCMDMQNLFARGGPWAAPWFERVLPQVEMLVKARPAATVFTRFIPPQRAEDMPGTWQRLYQRCAEVTRERLDARMLELAPALQPYAPPAQVIDKQRYSAFVGTPLTALLAERKATTLVFSGTETDVCVLASVLDAVDLGYRTVIAQDALCSSSDATHDAAIKLYHERLRDQVEIADVADILVNWRMP